MARVRRTRRQETEKAVGCVPAAFGFDHPTIPALGSIPASQQRFVAGLLAVAVLVGRSEFGHRLDGQKLPHLDELQN